MSFIVKGIDMPKEPHTIELNEKGIISVAGKDAIMIFQNAEIIEIPTPHGRLIDKDELLSHLKKDPLFDLVERYGISGVIESRPTILEAEDLL